MKLEKLKFSVLAFKPLPWMTNGTARLSLSFYMKKIMSI